MSSSPEVAPVPRTEGVVEAELDDANRRVSRGEPGARERAYALSAELDAIASAPAAAVVLEAPEPKVRKRAATPAKKAAKKATGKGKG